MAKRQFHIHKFELDDDGFKNTFLDGRLSIDCIEIALTQNGVSSPQKYTATGSILVSPNNGVEARLVCMRSDPSSFDKFAQLKAILSTTTSGQLIPESHYYSLSAKDVEGRVWTNPSINLRVDSSSTADVLTITCDYIETQENHKADIELAHLVFNDELELPLNVNSQSTERVRGGDRVSVQPSYSSGIVAGMSIQYHKCAADLDGEAFEFVAIAKDIDPRPNGFEFRLLEAIHFCTATMFSPVMSEIWRDNTRVIRLSKHREVNKSMFSPPLTARSEHLDFYRLMECYYNYACVNGCELNDSPLSLKLGSLFTLKGVWLDTIILVLSVTSEGILEDPLFKPIGKPSSDVLSKIKSFIEYVKKAPIEDSLLQRGISALGGMKHNRAVDKMYALAEVGAIEIPHIDSWKAVRNRSAHGNLEFEPEKLQELIDHMYQLITLIYKLIFLKIGYKGKYIDYSSQGWPIKDYDAPEILKLIPKT